MSLVCLSDFFYLLGVVKKHKKKKKKDNKQRDESPPPLQGEQIDHGVSTENKDLELSPFSDSEESEGKESKEQVVYAKKEPSKKSKSSKVNQSVHSSTWSDDSLSDLGETTMKKATIQEPEGLFENPENMPIFSFQ